MRKAVIVRTIYPICREDGSYIQFDNNSVVILNANLELVGTRIFGPVARELRAKKLYKNLFTGAGGSLRKYYAKA